MDKITGTILLPRKDEHRQMTDRKYGSDKREGGKWVPEVSDEEVLSVMDPGEPYGTREIAEAADMTRRTALVRLQDLADEGLIRKKKPDPRTAIWIKDEENPT